jgi:hypothetical protein
MTRAATSTRAIVVAILTALIAGLTAGGASATAPTAPTPSAPSAGARLATCSQGPQIDARSAVVSAWMKPLADAEHLTLKLDLYQRQLPAGHWTVRSDVPGLGTWTAPSDALVGTRAGDVFKYRQAVGRLVVGFGYRFRVGFRWLDDAGAVVRESAVTTRTCRQPDLRPDLVPTDVQVKPSPIAPGTFLYAVTVTNQGRTTVPRAVLNATYPGETTPGLHRHRVGRLAPGASVAITFTSPGCDAGDVPATFIIDLANAVDEANETNNQLVATCPEP